VQFVFGECVLDTSRRELLRGSEAVAVGPQVFDLLIHLIENRDRVVSKVELFDLIWRGRTVSESTLTSHVNFARRAIGDTGEEQRLIRTIPQRISIRCRRARGATGERISIKFGRGRIQLFACDVFGRARATRPALRRRLTFLEFER
jgi:hypothetical protein